MDSAVIQRSGISVLGPSSGNARSNGRQLNPGVHEIGARPVFKPAAIRVVAGRPTPASSPAHRHLREAEAVTRLTVAGRNHEAMDTSQRPSRKRGRTQQSGAGAHLRSVVGNICGAVGAVRNHSAFETRAYHGPDYGSHDILIACDVESGLHVRARCAP